MTLEIAISVTPPSGSPPQPKTTPVGNPFMEIANEGELTVIDTSGKSYPATWSSSSPDGTVLSYAPPPTDNTSWQVTGRGFGLVTIMAIVEGSKEQPAPLTICVGSVLILGADGQYWLVYPDGSIEKIPMERIHKDVATLRDSNAIVADLNGVPPRTQHGHTSPSEAVTCYVLNLASFAFDKPKKKP